MKKLVIQSLQVGEMGTNCYFLIHQDTKETLLVDPGADQEAIKSKVIKEGLNVVGILLTHGHFDHIGAVMGLKEVFQVDVYAHEKEVAVLESEDWNLSSAFCRGKGYTASANKLLKDGNILSLAGFQVQIIGTPGHTRGGVCYYIMEEATLVSGDTLFRESVGRSDFPTGNQEQLLLGIQEKISKLPKDTVVYPGHGMDTTIAHELECNPYLN